MEISQKGKSENVKGRFDKCKKITSDLLPYVNYIG